ncbi:MAG: trypsin-like peptidase domain-containing protein [Pseudomonadota bacterium]|nr:trypsin-like peptidase domain-containing protein [Pseudomonadota bacterium]MEC8977292.1 trypsin-like peptidase domain-containing protein [Pseudomonadota bacterium]
MLAFNTPLHTLLSITLLIISAQAASTTQKKPSLNKILADIMPKVATIYVESTTNGENNPDSIHTSQSTVPKNNTGTGFFISSNGLLLTNAHVVKDAKTILINLYDGGETTGNVIGIDHETDIALVKTTIKSTPFIQLEHYRQPQIGDNVYAIGNSFGLNHSVTKGIISALHRNITPHRVEDFIQTDSSINVGNSGGPLINQFGELVGINNMIIGVAGGNNGVGFAIPTSIARNISLQLAEHGNTKPGIVGIVSQNLTPDLAKALNAPSSEGVLVSQIIPESPAEKAHLKTGDVIVRINTDDVHSSSQMRANIYTQRAGSKLSITFYRNGKKKTAEVITESTHEPISKKDSSSKTNAPLEGVALVNHESIDLDGHKLLGLRVINVKEGTKAWLSGLYPNDIILKINQKSITSIHQLQRLKKSNSDKPWLLKIIRGTQNLFLAIKSN